MAGESPEVAAIRKNIVMITKAVTTIGSVQTFANGLQEKAFITQDAAQAILNTTGISPTEKASRLLDSVFLNLEWAEDPKARYDEFLGIFSSAAYAGLVKKLRIHGKEESSPTPTSLPAKSTGLCDDSTSDSASPPRPEKFARFTAKPDLVDLMELVGVDLQVFWEGIGGNLGLSAPQLTAIKANAGAVNPTMDCMRQVFVRWHDGVTSEYSWKHLAEVLCTKAVNQPRQLSVMYDGLSGK